MRSKLCSITLICIMITLLLCPIFTTQSFVYADSTIDQWESVTTNEELAEAFRYYCKSRNLSIEGSALDAVTSFTTSTFNNLCNTVGVDITALQANLKKSTDSNGKLQFLFDSTGISTYNRLFAEFLQNNDLSEGDTVDNTVLYSGSIFTDADGNSCLVYITNNYGQNVLNEGTTYLYSGTDYYNLYLNGITSRTFNLTSSVKPTIPFWKNDYNKIYSKYDVYSATLYDIATSTPYYDTAIFYDTSWNRYVFGFRSNGLNGYNGCQRFLLFTPSDSSHTDANVYITTNNQTINNNNYEGDTIINNEGDTVGESGGGESGGGESGGDTSIDVDFPDFNFNIPDLNFQLSGLTDKFPFCIPFDIVALLGLLNAEPQAPHIQGTIPFGNWFTWELDFDFSRFDDFATMMRGFELVGFIFFLVGATIHFAKG